MELRGSVAHFPFIISTDDGQTSLILRKLRLVVCMVDISLYGKNRWRPRKKAGGICVCFLSSSFPECLLTTETRCMRCRRQKIKCKGGCPCDNCKRRNAACTFEGEDTKILVTKKHLSELKQRTVELEKETNVSQEQLAGNNRCAEPSIDHANQKRSPAIGMDSCSIPISPDSSSDLSEPSLDGDGDHDERMVNPLYTGSPRYIRDIVGRPGEFYYCIALTGLIN